MSCAAISDIKRVKSLEDKYYNTKKEHDYFKIFSRYVQSGCGTYNLFRILSYGCLWPIRFASILGLSDRTVEKLLITSKKFKFINKNLILNKYPHDIVELDKSYKDYKKAQAYEKIKNTDKLAFRVVETVADSCFIMQLGEILSLYSLKALSPVVNLAGNFFAMLSYGISLKLNVNKYFTDNAMQKIIKSEKNPSERSISLFQEIKNLDLIYVAKSAMQLALSTLLIIDIIFQIAVFSAGSLLLLSTCITVLAIWSHFYKETMTYPLLSS